MVAENAPLMQIINVTKIMFSNNVQKQPDLNFVRGSGVVWQRMIRWGEGCLTNFGDMCAFVQYYLVQYHSQRTIL